MKHVYLLLLIGVGGEAVLIASGKPLKQQKVLIDRCLVSPSLNLNSARGTGRFFEPEDSFVKKIGSIIFNHSTIPSELISIITDYRFGPTKRQKLSFDGSYSLDNIKEKVLKLSDDCASLYLASPDCFKEGQDEWLQLIAMIAKQYPNLRFVSILFLDARRVLLDKDFIIRSLSQLPELEVLHLGHFSEGRVDWRDRMRALAELKQVRMLTIDNCKLRNKEQLDLFTTGLSSMPNLHTLAFHSHGCRISTDALCAIAQNVPQLHTIVLSSCLVGQLYSGYKLEDRQATRKVLIEAGFVAYASLRDYNSVGSCSVAQKHVEGCECCVMLSDSDFDPNSDWRIGVACPELCRNDCLNPMGDPQDPQAYVFGTIE